MINGKLFPPQEPRTPEREPQRYSDVVGCSIIYNTSLQVYYCLVPSEQEINDMYRCTVVQVHVYKIILEALYLHHSYK